MSGVCAPLANSRAVALGELSMLPLVAIQFGDGTHKLQCGFHGAGSSWSSKSRQQFALTCNVHSNSVSFLMRNVTDMPGRLAKQFVANALNIREGEQSAGNQNSPTYCHSARNAAETIASSKSSRQNSSTPAGEQTVQSVFGLASIPAAELNEEDKRERIRQLDALAALRQGRMLEESQVYRQTCVIRSYEVSADGTTSIDTILSLFQEVALNHVSLLGIAGVGFGATLGMNRNRLIWVITRLKVEIDRYPTWPEAVEIDSWVGSAGKNGMRRDWLLREHASGKIIAKATSTWVMMHKDTRRLSKIPDDVKAEIVPVFIDKCAMGDLSVERIPKLDDKAQNIVSNLTSSKADLDVNQHINNVTYVRWVMQSTSPSTLETHQVSSITLEYRRECNEDDVVESLTNPEATTQPLQEKPPFSEGADSTVPPVNGKAVCSNGSSTFSIASPVNGNAFCTSNYNFLGCSTPIIHTSLPTLQYIHLLRLQSTGAEIVRARTVWKAKTLKNQNQ